MKNLFRKKLIPLLLLVCMIGTQMPMTVAADSVSVYASDPYLDRQ